MQGLCVHCFRVEGFAQVSKEHITYPAEHSSEARVQETLTVEWIACCDPNIVGCPPCESFIHVFEFENCCRSLLGGLVNMVICNEAVAAFVMLCRGSKDPQLLV